MAQTIWSLLPPVIAIGLALWTKEVYVSLLISIFIGALIFTEGNILLAVITVFQVIADKIGSNANILIFLVILGILVSAITRSGATKAYGEWAKKTMKSGRSSLIVTAVLGLLIFIDDYFNCLTVGTVMRPVTDKFQVARAKLAYIIDATAAPVCIIAPVSSWAAAVGSSLPSDSGIDGFALFLQTIPYNLYAILTIVFMSFIVWTGHDFGPMARSVRESKEHFEVPEEYKDTELTATGEVSGNGRIFDLLLPLAVLIASCVMAMIYTGGYFAGEGKSIADAFASCESSQSLVLGSFLAFVFTAILYLPRRIVSFHAFCDSFSRGFKAMTPAIFILCLAWALSGICSDKYLNLGGYVGALVSSHTEILLFLPAVFFLTAIGLAFATGTSWGTFGILIPIAAAVIGTSDPNMLAICVAAILSGAVGGDHASPISDTTILASAGAQCSHIVHVSTQIPYVAVVASASLIGYLADGLTANGLVGLATGLAVLTVCMMVIARKKRKG